MEDQSKQATKPKKRRKLSEIRLGEFLAALNVLPPTKLKAALKISQKLGLPIGRTLVVRGLLSNETLATLLDLHVLFKRGKLDFNEVSEAYEMTEREGWHVRDSLRALNIVVDEVETVRLGELLVASDIIDKKKLDDSLTLQSMCGLPLGKILTIDSSVAQEIIDAALDYQQKIRTNAIPYEEVVDKLKMMPFLLNTDSIRPVINLNLKDLLLGSKICDDAELAPALSYAKANKKSLETVLFKYEFMDMRLVSAAVALSKLVERGYISAQDAMQFLSGVKSGDSLRQARKNTEKSPELRIMEGDLNLYNFLIAAGYINSERIRELTKEMINQATKFGELVDKPIDSNTPRKEVKQSIMECFATDAMLAPVLVEIGGMNEAVIGHARNLVDLVVIGGATVEQVLLSFAWFRWENELNQSESEE